MERLMECFTHPVKCKLLLEIQSAGAVTAKHLIETYQDIPQTTLYRYLRQMTQDGILKIVEETPVRGTVEKTYGLAVDLGASIEGFLEHNPKDAYMMLFMQYILGFVRSFQNYCKRPEIDIKKDLGTFTAAPIYASDQELMDALSEIGKVIGTLMENKPGGNRKLRTLGVMITPPESQEPS